MQDFKCTRKEVKETCRFISWGGWWQQQSRMEMSCQAYCLTTKVSSPPKVDLNQPLPDDWCRLISQNHIMPALFDHDFGGNRVRGCTWCLSIWSPASVSTWTIEVYIVLTSLFHTPSGLSYSLEAGGHDLEIPPLSSILGTSGELRLSNHSWKWHGTEQ